MKKINNIWFPERDITSIQRCQHVSRHGFQLDHLAQALKYVTNWRISIDGGANIGWWTKEMSKQFNHVYSFELDPDTFACFEKNVEYWKISNVTIKNCGLSNTHQFVGIADGRTKRSGGRHIKGSGSIPTTTIDALQLSNLDFLKLDLEGHEAKALEGARETLTAFHPIVIIEHKPHLARRYGGPNDAIDILHELGASLLDKVGKDNIDWVFGW